jgi:hypothetical protein
MRLEDAYSIAAGEIAITVGGPCVRELQRSALYKLDIQPAMARPISSGESSWT